MPSLAWSEIRPQWRNSPQTTLSGIPQSGAPPKSAAWPSTTAPTAIVFCAALNTPQCSPSPRARSSATVVRSNASRRTPPEPELAVVIGKTAKSIRAADAYDYVFGYTIHNDITSPTMRGEDTFQYRAIHPKGDDPGQIEYVDTWVSYPGRYKCADTFACMGPWLVTKDEIPDPHALGVSCLHKDRLVTQDTTANLTHKVPEVLAFLSDYVTLWPGDIVSMGTALAKSAGGGAVQNIDLNRLGGPVSVVIERVGTLSNPVVQVIRA